MGLGPWGVKKDEDREQWALAPTVGVGPLRFGMTSREVADALAPHAISAAKGSSIDNSDLWSLTTSEDQWSPHFRPRWFQFSTLGVTTHYSNIYCLEVVAVDALTGPQVLLDGVPLTGRVPSELERWICEHTEAKGLDLHYTYDANPASTDLGLTVRVQRAGDVVLTRPVLTVRELARDAWECLPADELHTF